LQVNKPANPTPATAAKLPDSRSKATATNNPGDRVSLGLLSMVVGGFALSLDAVPQIRFLAVLLSLGGLTLAILEFRSKEKKAGPHFARACAGATICTIVLLLTIIRPFWSMRNTRPAQARTASSDVPPADNAALPSGENSQSTATVADSGPSSPQALVRVLQEIPFPCGKHLKLVPVEIEEPDPAEPASAAAQQPKPRFPGAKTTATPQAAKVASQAPRKPLQWIDASTSAAQEGDVCVCVVSAGVERLNLSSAGKTTAAASDSLVIHLQVVLIGTRQKEDFAGWSNSNFGGALHMPTLADSANNSYRLQRFSRDTEIVDHARPKSLYPKLYADDYLYFELPRPNFFEFLRLELPESAFGGAGKIRFQIPNSMIEVGKDNSHKT
jgi:hypothetical protein